ncbi:MAG: hypothetical protein ACI9WO_001043, partial [Sphingobacteriales bacterium]
CPPNSLRRFVFFISEEISLTISSKELSKGDEVDFSSLWTIFNQY